MDYLTSIDQVLSPGAQFPPVGQVSLNARQKPGRLDVMGTNKLLFEGKHELVYEDWDKLARADQSIVELVVNFHRRLSRLWKSLMLTEPPTITANKEAQDWVDALVKTSRLVGGMGSAVIDQSRWGVGMLKVTDRTGDGKVAIKAQPAYIGDGKHHAGGWFPIVDPLDLQEITAHILAWTEHRREEVWGVPVVRKYVHAEIHRRGSVERQTWLMDGQTVKQMTEEPSVVEIPGLDDFLLIPVHNGLTSDSQYGCDDYQDLDALLHEIELRLSQLSKILDKHSDPNMSGPAHMVTNASPGQAAAQQAQAAAQGGQRGITPRALGPQVSVGGKFFGRNPDDPEVQYVTWDPRIEGIKWEVETLLQLVYVLSETSPAVFGQIEGGVASGSALKRLLMAPLLKVADMRNAMETGVIEALMAANALARANGSDVPELTSVEIGWKDGLPQDLTEDASVATLMYGAELASKETAIGKVYGTEGDALKEELKLIDKEKKANTPPPAPDAAEIVEAARGGVIPNPDDVPVPAKA